MVAGAMLSLGSWAFMFSVFIGGYEDGGTMALRIALRNPRQFSGAISMKSICPAGTSMSLSARGRRKPRPAPVTG